MISLKDYIKKSVVESNYPKWDENDIHDHFFIEFELNLGIILEKYGRYDGQTDLVKELTENVYSDNFSEKSQTYKINADEINKGASEEEKFPGLFYHELIVKRDPKSEKTSYIPIDNNFDYKENKFNKVYIILGKNSLKGKTRIFKSLMHELTHAWHDYNSYIKDEFGNNKGNSLIYLEKESKYYRNIRNNIPTENSERLCKLLMYVTTKFESNAYSSEIYGELEIYDGEIISWKDAWKVFRNSSTYNEILSLYNELNNIENKSEDYKNKFKNYYNTFNKSDLTLNKIIKKLKNQLEKTFEHIMKNCSKIYYEWTEKQEIEKNIKEGINEYIPLDEF